MIVSVDEMKNYLRIDFDDDDILLNNLIKTAECMCADVARTSIYELGDTDIGKIAVAYATAYLYENRENADHNKLLLTLRAMLFGIREGGF